MNFLFKNYFGEKMGLTKKLKLLIYSISIIFIIFYTIQTLYLFSKKTLNPSSILIIITSLLLSCVVWWLIAKYKLISLYFIVFLYGLIYILLVPVFSPIDEAAHFDYINKIMFEHKLPLISDLIDVSRLSEVSSYAVPVSLQYEAVHPPIYYFLGSLIVYPFQDYPSLSLIILRLVGLLLLLTSLYFTIKTFSILSKYFKWYVNEVLFTSILLLLYTNPGIVTRMVTVSNESLTVCLFSLLIYLMVEFVITSHSVKKLRVISIITGCLVLTKITSVVIIVPLLLIFLFIKSWRYIFEFSLIIGIIVLPWIIFNLYHYHSFTGTEEHVEFVKKIVNPHNVNLGFEYVVQKFTYILYSFWVPQEIRWSGIYELANLITYGLSLGLILCIASTISTICKLQREKQLNLNAKLNSVLIIFVFLSLIMLIYGTLSQDVDILLGRYLYITIVPISLFIYMQLIEIPLKKVSFYIISIVVISSYFTYSGMVYFSQGKNFLDKIINGDVNLDNLSRSAQEGLFEKNLGLIPKKLAEQWGNSLYKDKVSYVSINSLPVSHDLIIRSNKYYINGKDPFLVWKTIGTNMKTGDLLIINVQLDKHSDNNHVVEGQVFWESNNNPFDEAKSYRFIMKNGKVIVPIGYHKDWKDGSELLNLRLDFDNLNEDEGFTVDSLKISRLEQ